MPTVNLLNGDCLELMKDIPDSSVDCIICDLPYGVTAQNEWDKKLPLDKLWSQYLRVAKTSAPIILFGQGIFTAELIMSNPQDFKYTLVWDKVLPSGFLNANRQPLRTHEDIIVFYREQPTYNPQKYKGDACHSRGNGVGNVSSGTNYGTYNMVETIGDDKFPGSILRYQKPHASTVLHPTQKPVELLEYLIKTYSNEEDIILDNCFGAGSTAVACVNTNRQFIGMEIDPKYYEYAQQRVSAAEHGAGYRIQKSKANSKKLF